MKKFMIIRNPYDQSLAVWEYIDDVKEAMKYWYVKYAIDKYCTLVPTQVCPLTKCCWNKWVGVNVQTKHILFMKIK